MSKKLWTYSTLTVIVLLTWLAADWLAPKPKTIQNPIRHQPDSFSKHFIKITMTAEGKPKHKLIAESMVHYKDDDSTELEKPVFTFFKPDSPPWVVHADSGRISSQGETLFLSPKVLIHRAPAPGFEPVTIRTRNLTIKQKIDYAETNQFAELISNQNRISGVGLSLYFGEHKQIILRSKVKGRYYAR
ncbi:MAG: LPS export ABC transporter periplasmic protein LptC [Gammaproteobacteria bacterium]